MTKSMVSVILPVYNGENTVLETIKSVLKQSYTYIQLIIVNDGSVDNTDKICKSITDQRIDYFKIENGGVSKARNFALTKVKGEFIMFIDSDDLYEDTYIEKMVKKMSKGFELITCGYSNFEKNTKIYLPANCSENDKLSYIENLQKTFLFNQIWNKIYLKKIIRDNNIVFDEEISIAEDWKFNINYLNHITKYTSIPEPLYNYRITNTGLGFKYRKDASKIKLEIVDMMAEYFIISEKNKMFITKSYIKQYYSWFSNILDKRNNSKLKEKLDKINNILNSKSFIKRLNNSKCENKRDKILLLFLQKRKLLFIFFLAILANFYDKINKKIKFGL